MDGALSQNLCIAEDVLQPLLTASSTSTLNDALQNLTEISKTDDGRSDLASKAILPTVLQLVQSLIHSSTHQPLLLSLRLLRNLCAGEVVNQDSFIEHNGVEAVLAVIDGIESDDSGIAIIRAALQVIANVSLAGEKHQHAIWNQFFPKNFLKIARIRRRDTCDPLSMIIYACSDGSIELLNSLCESSGLAIIAELTRTASEAGYGEDWLKLLLSRICLEECHFLELFNMLSQDTAPENFSNAEKGDTHFTSEQAFLLCTVSEILNERLKEIQVHSDFAFHVLDIFERAAKVVDFDTRVQSGLPTGHALIDVLGYSLTIIRDICAQGSSLAAESKQGSKDIVCSFVSQGLLDLLLALLRELELPSSIRKTMKPDDNQGLTSEPRKVCPYKGFRRDIVAVIGNCAYMRKHIQDEIRQKDGVFLLLQQCVLDEDNPFLREWGIWCARNLLNGNPENQQLVASLEMQGTVDVPELTQLGLRVEVDPNTRRAKLVNIT